MVFAALIWFVGYVFCLKLATRDLIFSDPFSLLILAFGLILWPIAIAIVGWEKFKEFVRNECF